MNSTKHCSGCHNDFYNDNNPYGVKRCWSLSTAKLITRFKLGVSTPMWLREAYVKVTKPNCYHQTGSVFLEQIPDSAKTPAERAIIEKREKEQAA